MKKKRILTIILLAGIFAYSIVGFLVIPMAVKSMLPEKLGGILNRTVRLDDVYLNPFTLFLELEGLKIKETNSANDFVSLDRLGVNVQAASILRLGLVIKKLTLDSPFVRIVRIEETTFNFSDLLEQDKDRSLESTEATASDPFEFELRDIRINDGRIDVWDEVVQKSHTMKDISFQIPFFSNFKKHHDTRTTPGLDVQLNDTRITADLSSKPFADSLETVLKLEIKGIRLPHYVDYIPNDLGFSVTSGMMDISSDIFLTKREDETMLINTSGNIALHDLEITDQNGDTMLRFPELSLAIGPSKPLENDIRIEKIIMGGPEINVLRDAQGHINLLSLGKPGTADTPADTASPEPPQEQEPKPFRLVVDELSVDSGWLRCRDAFVGAAAGTKPSEPVDIAMGPIDLNVTNISTAPGSTGRFELATRLNDKGDINADGRFGISPVSIHTRFNLTDIVFTWIEPYLREHVHLALTDGRFSSAGNLSLEQTDASGLTASISGDASIEDVRTMDTVYAEDFISLKGLYLSDVNVSYNPIQIELKTVNLKGLNHQIVLHDDGGLNLEKIAVSKPAPADAGKTATDTPAAPAAGAAVIPVSVETIAMQDIHVSFIDQQITPNFATNLKLSSVNISGLTSKEFEVANVDIKGKIDDYAPVEVVGKINPLTESLFADMTLTLNNMELSPLTPYTGKYIGNAIEKGKLSLNIAAKIEKRAVKAEDAILFDQLTLGHAVESPDALQLPMGLAISLLKDRSGQIHLDVPVSGRLDDPDFSIGGVMLQALVNIVEKAATSPFTLVANVAGGGEELRFIEFDAGQEELNDMGRRKLDSIITLLYERPGLSLSLTGYVDPDQDRKQLEDLTFLNKIKAQKRLSMDRDSQAPESLQDIDILPDEYMTYLALAYTAETSSEPEDDMTPEDMEKRIRQGIVVRDAELKLLALNRAKQVKSYILNDTRIESSRLFLSEAATLAPEESGNFGTGRVELSLQ